MYAYSIRGACAAAVVLHLIQEDRPARKPKKSFDEILAPGLINKRSYIAKLQYQIPEFKYPPTGFHLIKAKSTNILGWDLEYIGSVLVQ